MWLFLLFVAVPVVEIGLFIQVGGVIGLWPTLAIVVLTALVGTRLMRAQGAYTLSRLQTSLAEGRNPADPMAQGAMILVAGVLLLTPGFFTDGVGFALLLPPVRAVLIRWISARITSGQVIYQQTAYRGPEKPADESTIDGDYSVLDETDESRPPGPSKWSSP